MITQVTSIADLLFKAKTNSAYQELLCMYVKYNWSNGMLPSYIEALEVLDEKVNIPDCSMLVRDINQYRQHIVDPADVAFNETGADDARPSMNSNDDNMVISSNNRYSAIGEEYERRRSQTRTEGNRFVTSNQSIRGYDYEILEESFNVPFTNERINVQRSVPLNVPASTRQNVINEMRADLDRRIVRVMSRETERNNTNYYDNHWDNDVEYFYRRPNGNGNFRINEDSPNNER